MFINLYVDHFVYLSNTLAASVEIRGSWLRWLGEFRRVPTSSDEFRRVPTSGCHLTSGNSLKDLSLRSSLIRLIITEIHRDSETWRWRYQKFWQMKSVHLGAGAATVALSASFFSILVRVPSRKFMKIQYVSSWTWCTVFVCILVASVFSMWQMPQLQHEATTNKRCVQSCLHGITDHHGGFPRHEICSSHLGGVSSSTVWPVGREQHRIKNWIRIIWIVWICSMLQFNFSLNPSFIAKPGTPHGGERICDGTSRKAQVQLWTKWILTSFKPKQRGGSGGSCRRKSDGDRARAWNGHASPLFKNVQDVRFICKQN